MGNAAKPITVQVYDADVLDHVQEMSAFGAGGYLLYEDDKICCSNINDRNKHTKKAAACLVPILAGTAKDGSEQSGMAHLSRLMNRFPHQFEEIFRHQLNIFAEKTEPGTRAAVVLAGHVPPLNHQLRSSCLSDYLQRMKMIRDEIERALKIETTVIAGPTRTPGSHLNVYYHTQKRVAGILVARPGDVCFTESFLASDAEKIAESWL